MHEGLEKHISIILHALKQDIMYFQACCCHFLLFYILSNFIMPLSLSKKSSGQEIPEKRRCIFSKDSCINSSVWYAIKMSYINAFLQHLLTQKRIILSRNRTISTLQPSKSSNSCLIPAKAKKPWSCPSI